MSTHDVEALIVGCPDVAVALGDREVALADVADGAHEDGRVAQRRLHEGVGQRRDPPQPLALPVQVHEEDAALELGGGRRGAEFNRNFKGNFGSYSKKCLHFPHMKET